MDSHELFRRSITVSLSLCRKKPLDIGNLIGEAQRRRRDSLAVCIHGQVPRPRLLGVDMAVGFDRADHAVFVHRHVLRAISAALGGVPAVGNVHE